MARIYGSMKIANIVLLLAVALIPLGVHSADIERISERELGKLPDGKIVKIFTLKNKNGVIVRLSNWGATITEIHVPDKNGRLTMWLSVLMILNELFKVQH
jgi:hypothetical protein